MGSGRRSSKEAAKLDSKSRLKKDIPVPKVRVCPVLQALLKRSKAAIATHFKSTKFFDAPLSVDNYAARFAQLSMMERITRQMELDEYARTRVPIQLQFKRHAWYLQVGVRNVKESLSQLTTYDRLRFSRPSDELRHKVVFVGDIDQLLDHGIVVKLHPKNAKQIDDRLLYDVQFLINGYAFDVECDALRLVCEQGVVQRLFPGGAVDEQQLPDSTPPQLQWINGAIAQNPRQQQAVRHIVAGTAHPAPYILFGPPGTGKTQTLVEAIAQIRTRDALSRIMVCATSNAAADELALRLIRTPVGQDVYRLYSSTYESPIDGELRRRSNYGLNCCPEWKILDKYRIFVATLFTGGALRYARPPADYFTHLFLDECGSASELATLVPIACAAQARIVLSGDPKQLGPVVLCSAADRFGLGLSLLERLMSTVTAYRKHPRTKRYNANVLTKLVNNYRSHPAILAPSNRLFYDNEMVACSASAKTECFIGWRHLPAPNVPIIVHECTEPSETEGTSKSIFNTLEVRQVWHYVSLVLQEQIDGRPVSESDIGVIAPYKKQCAKISELLRRNQRDGIMVDTVEKFQGQERPIIIVSTTRSKMNGIGFLRDPKRLNVLLTRAQCLLVIVGNPQTLEKDTNWRKVLHGFRAAGVCTAAPLMAEVATTPRLAALPKKKKKKKANGKASQQSDVPSLARLMASACHIQPATKAQSVPKTKVSKQQPPLATTTATTQPPRAPRVNQQARSRLRHSLWLAEKMKGDDPSTSV